MSNEEKNNSVWKEAAGLFGKDKKSLILLIGALVILLCAGIFLGVVIGKGNGNTAVPEETGTVESAAEETETESTEAETAAYVNAPLEVDAYPEVNALIKQYYEAAAKGDTDTILSLRDQCGQTELLQIREKSKYMEAYEDIKCYTKPGPAEDSFVVYVSYYAKFVDVEQRVCGLNTYVVCKNEQGSYYIHDCEGDEAMKEYRTNVTKQDDVVELFNQVQVEYNETVTSNEELAEFLTDLSTRLKAAVGDALAEAESQEEAETAGTGTEVTEAAEEFVPSIVTANDVVNIRKSDSQTAESLGKARIGEEFTLLENKPNGWSRVEYNGGDAYIKSEFLDGEAMNQEAGAQQTESEAAEEPADSEQEASVPEDSDSDIPSSGEFRLNGTVNVRKSPSETADRIGVAYSGEVVEIIQKQADGWTKVKFKGATGYIKTEVLK